jgi:hypothetical protein
MVSVSGWGVDEVTLKAVYQDWLREHEPEDSEVGLVDEFLETLKAKGPVGRRVPGTNVVIDYEVDSKNRILWISKIGPP